MISFRPADGVYPFIVWIREYLCFLCAVHSWKVGTIS